VILEFFEQLHGVVGHFMADAPGHFECVAECFTDDAKFVNIDGECRVRGVCFCVNISVNISVDASVNIRVSVRWFDGRFIFQRITLVVRVFFR